MLLTISKLISSFSISLLILLNELISIISNESLNFSWIKGLISSNSMGLSLIIVCLSKIISSLIYKFLIGVKLSLELPIQIS